MSDDQIPTQAASHFAIAINPTELLVAVGESKLKMVVKNGANTPDATPKWLMTLALSPTAAAHLHSLLGAGIEEYEKRFGKIPRDPKFTVNRNMND